MRSGHRECEVVTGSGIVAGQVLVSLHTDGAAAALVRADVQVGWYPSRSQQEYLGGLHVMTITGPATAARSLATVIGRVTALLNGLPALPVAPLCAT